MMKRKLMISRKSVAWLLACSAFACSCATSQQRAVNTSFKVMEVSQTDKTLSTDYSASITGKQNVEVRPQISGMLTEVSIKEGAPVKKGQKLFVIDQTPYKAALQTAVANVENATANVATAQLTANSKQELFNEAVVSDFDLQTAKNSLLMAKAALSQAKAQEVIARENLSYTVISSPVNGVASMTSYRVGALVNPSIVEPLVVVSDDTDMYAYFSMTEQQILSLSRQNGSLENVMNVMPEVSLRLSDGTMYDQKGRVDAISGIINSATGAVAVRAIFANPNGVLRGGGTGNIVMPYYKKDAIVIPQAATFEIQDRVFAYKVEDGKAVSTPISVFEISDGTEYIVESGLKLGDTIISEGAGLVAEGTPVNQQPQSSEQPQPAK